MNHIDNEKSIKIFRIDLEKILFFFCIKLQKDYE